MEQKYYELIDRHGDTSGPYSSIDEAVRVAKLLWPDQEQDEDSSGKGWTVQPVGADIVWQRSNAVPVKV